MARARCNARLTAGWLSSSRDAAAVMLFSSAIAANVIRRFKSTCRSFSKRMTPMTIMHEPHAAGESSLAVYARRMHKEDSMQGNGLQDKRGVVLGGSSGVGLEV